MSNEEHFCGQCTCYWACQLFSDVTHQNDACQLFESKQTKKRARTEELHYEAYSTMPRLDAHN